MVKRASKSSNWPEFAEQYTTHRPQEGPAYAGGHCAESREVNDKEHEESDGSWRRQAAKKALYGQQDAEQPEGYSSWHKQTPDNSDADLKFCLWTKLYTLITNLVC